MPITGFEPSTHRPKEWGGGEQALLNHKMRNFTPSDPIHLFLALRKKKEKKIFHNVEVN